MGHSQKCSISSSSLWNLLYFFSPSSYQYHSSIFFVLCLSDGMTSVSIWTFQKLWQLLERFWKVQVFMYGNLSLVLVFSSPIQLHKHSTWIRSAESWPSSLSPESSHTYSKKRTKLPSSPSPFFWQQSSMSCRWLYSNRPKIWNSIQHWCFLVSVPLFFSFLSGKNMKEKEDLYSYFSPEFSQVLHSEWRLPLLCFFSEDSDWSHIDTSHWEGISDSFFSSYPYSQKEISGRSSTS